MYPTEDHICANCAHCSTYTVTVLGRNMHICAKSALDGDVEGTWTLVSLESNCTDYAGEWSPSADYIAELADTEALHHDAAAYYGVLPGKDFPATIAI